MVTKLLSSIQGAVPNKVYVNVLVVAPTAGVKVPPPALKAPPDPVVCVHVPPDCSPVIKLNKSITAELLSQISVLPSVPATGCGLILMVATLLTFIHGAAPSKL